MLDDFTNRLRGQNIGLGDALNPMGGFASALGRSAGGALADSATGQPGPPPPSPDRPALSVETGLPERPALTFARGPQPGDVPAPVDQTLFGPPTPPGAQPPSMAPPKPT